MLPSPAVVVQMYKFTNGRAEDSEYISTQRILFYCYRFVFGPLNNSRAGRQGDVSLAQKMSRGHVVLFEEFELLLGVLVCG
jgi:hypothetical protein